MGTATYPFRRGHRLPPCQQVRHLHRSAQKLHQRLRSHHSPMGPSSGAAIAASAGGRVASTALGRASSSSPRSTIGPRSTTRAPVSDRVVVMSIGLKSMRVFEDDDASSLTPNRQDKTTDQPVRLRHESWSSLSRKFCDDALLIDEERLRNMPSNSRPMNFFSAPTSVGLNGRSLTHRREAGRGIHTS